MAVARHAWLEGHGSARLRLSARDGANGETIMNEDALNSSVRKFLKKVGITSQREIEKAVRDATARGALKPSQKLPATMRLHVGGIELLLQIDGEIELD
jgi:hypothetical protein